MSQIPPCSFRFVAPPDPPDVAEADGGASGMVRISSAPDLTTVLITSERSNVGIIERSGAKIDAIALAPLII